MILLKKFIETIKVNHDIYFIDAVNRIFDTKKIIRSGKKPAYKKSILETRLEEAYFNLTDSFNCYGTLTERVEMIYCLYEKEVQNLFWKLTGDRFHILYDNPMGEVGFGNGTAIKIQQKKKI